MCIAFPLQIWFRERASMLGLYAHCLSLYIYIYIYISEAAYVFLLCILYKYILGFVISKPYICQFLLCVFVIRPMMTIYFSQYM